MSGRSYNNRSRCRSLTWSGWWLDICNLYWGPNGDGIYREFNREVDNGEGTKFYGDC